MADPPNDASEQRLRDELVALGISGGREYEAIMAGIGHVSVWFSWAESMLDEIGCDLIGCDFIAYGIIMSGTSVTPKAQRIHDLCAVRLIGDDDLRRQAQQYCKNLIKLAGQRNDYVHSLYVNEAAAVTRFKPYGKKPTTRKPVTRSDLNHLQADILEVLRVNENLRDEIHAAMKEKAR